MKNTVHGTGRTGGTRSAFAFVVASALALPAVAADVPPADVVWEEGVMISASLSGAPGDPESGKKVMATRSQGNCLACHAISALSEQQFHGNVGPSLDGVADRYSEAELRGLVANAKNTFDGTIMPAFYKDAGYIRPGEGYTAKAATELKPLLSAQQIEDIVAFLVTLKE